MKLFSFFTVESADRTEFDGISELLETFAQTGDGIDLSGSNLAAEMMAFKAPVFSSRIDPTLEERLDAGALVLTFQSADARKPVDLGGACREIILRMSALGFHIRQSLCEEFPERGYAQVVFDLHGGGPRH